MAPLSRLTGLLRPGLARFASASSAAAADVPPLVRVHVEFCNACGGIYRGVMERQLAAVDRRLGPQAEVSAAAGRIRSLEVFVAATVGAGAGAAGVVGQSSNPAAVYLAASKLGSGVFPDVSRVAEQVAAFVESGKAAEGWAALPGPDAERVLKLMDEG
jgi:hypothetical protein